MAVNSKKPSPRDAVIGGNNPPAKGSTGSTGRQSSQSPTSLTTVNTGATGGQPSQSQTSSTNSSSIQTTSGSETSADGCLVFMKWIIWMGLTWATVTDPSMSLIESFGSLSAGAWMIGLISPSLVIRFGLPKSRWTVTLIYLTLALALTKASSH